MEDAAQKVLDEFQSKLDKAIHHLTDQLATIRTGRASPALVDSIRVEYYGTPTPIQQLAHISVPEPRQLLLKPFDATVMKDMERALLKSDLGLTPNSDGKVLRLSLPPLSGEQREKLVAKVKEIAEASRVALRNARRDANKAADAAGKAGGLNEDQNRDLHDAVDTALKKAEKDVSTILDKKSHEIRED